MAHIKFSLERESTEDGMTRMGRVSMLESTLPMKQTYELNIIMHALSAPQHKVEVGNYFDYYFPITL